MNINDVIKQQRLASQLTQEELATELFVSRQLISNWERGKSYPNLEQIIQLSDFFNISLDELIKGDTKMTKTFDRALKLKKGLYFALGLLAVLIINGFISNVPLASTQFDIPVTKLTLVRDKTYDGGDMYRDFNTDVTATIKQTNPFIRVNPDTVFFHSDHNYIFLNATKSFNLFHIFTWSTPITIKNSIMLDNKIPNKELELEIPNANLEVVDQETSSKH
ncbi:helix-turn-helix domain-containing protein [Weissella ceti]|uniref:Helix-turn-helix domain-containing protein n=1 Tax=Weissella ceti TaxID=759620 RepID=A0ABT3E4M8_9LACO|nr:helix-turn-helix transcriptional regulator [Weissella ceti]MCW0953391.1 helix-turn-helix domain-containing protein [Weissella ceti]QVK11995.1 helix-turn-helix transcriptional regulator [Weissella ceti]